MIDEGQVKVNEKVISKNLKIKNKDEIFIETKNEKLVWVEAEEMKLDILYEDENLLVINKDAGVNVHPVPGSEGKTWTIVNGVLHHCGKNVPSIRGVDRPGIVHRLDKDTSGLLLVAKTDYMMNYLADIIKSRNIEKNYIAIVNGMVKDKKFKIESFIGRDPNDRQKMTAKNPINPKLALSFGEVLGYINDKYTILKINIKTWRTHQIRVHLSSIGFPIIWDKVYGNKEVNTFVKEKFGLNRQALHAYELKFDLYGKKVEFKANLKKDMKKLVPNFNF